MPTGWKIHARRNGGKRLEYIVNADDADSAIAVVRALEGMRDAQISIDEDGPGEELCWLAMAIGETRRVFCKASYSERTMALPLRQSLARLDPLRSARRKDALTPGPGAC
jgi:hypothetical protein